MKYIIKYIICPIMLLPFFVMTKVFQISLVLLKIIWHFNFKKEWITNINWLYTCIIVGEVAPKSFKHFLDIDEYDMFLSEYDGCYY